MPLPCPGTVGSSGLTTFFLNSQEMALDVGSRAQGQEAILLSLLSWKGEGVNSSACCPEAACWERGSSATGSREMSQAQLNLPRPRVAEEEAEAH